jgi:hypothetical protein
VLGVVREPAGDDVLVGGRTWTGQTGWRHFTPQTR